MESAVKKYPPAFEEPHGIKGTVYYLATSKHCPYNDADAIYDLDWEEFISALDWVHVCVASEVAAHTKDQK